MKTHCKLLIAFLFVIMSIFACKSANVILDFKTSDIAYPIDSVVVINQNSGLQITLKNNLTIELFQNISDVDLIEEDVNIFSILMGGAISEIGVKLNSPKSTSFKLSLFKLNGEKLFDLEDNAETGCNYYDISAPKGIYILQFNNKEEIYCSKLISNSNSTKVSICKKSFVPFYGKMEKSKYLYNQLMFNTGDRFIFKSFCGKFQTISTCKILRDTTIYVDFYKCEDGKGQNYAITKIGNQIWMAENLKYVPDSINSVTNGSEDTGKEKGSFYYSYDTDKYGILYNWNAAIASVPKGWHLPTKDEWTQLFSALGGDSIAGGKMKSITGWDQNYFATNESCFNGFPGGARSSTSILNVAKKGYWWTASTNDATLTNKYYISLYNLYKYTLFLTGSPSLGMSVRCIKD